MNVPKKVRNFEVPECFSIIENETESYLLLRQIISAFIYQTCDEIWLDYNKRNGTIQFIDSFFKLKGNDKADNISRMYLLSGNTRIEFDGTYKLVDIKDENGTSRGIISFNKSGKLTDVPDKKYVYTVPNYFPGTAIFAKLLINDDDLNNEQN